MSILCIKIGQCLSTCSLNFRSISSGRVGVTTDIELGKLLKKVLFLKRLLHLLIIIHAVYKLLPVYFSPNIMFTC